MSFSFFLIVIVTIYTLIPNSVTYSYQVLVHCTEPAAQRFITNKSLWNEWWPGDQKEHNLFSYREREFRLDKIYLKGFEASILYKDSLFKGRFQIVYSNDTTTTFLWIDDIYYSAYPWERLSQYISYRNMKPWIENLMNDIKSFFDRQENVYGFKVFKEKVKDSSLVATIKKFKHYPTTSEIYGMVESIKKYIEKKNGKEVNYPMLNVQIKDSIHKAMVAIPVEKDLPSEGNFEMRRMILGNILSAEIKGGIYTINKGEEQLSNYVDDHHKESPAIPFQSLITNRQLETDTSKWITKLYYPVF